MWSVRTWQGLSLSGIKLVTNAWPYEFPTSISQLVIDDFVMGENSVPECRRVLSSRMPIVRVT